MGSAVMGKDTLCSWRRQPEPSIKSIGPSQEPELHVCIHARKMKHTQHGHRSVSGDQREKEYSHRAAERPRLGSRRRVMAAMVLREPTASKEKKWEKQETLRRHGAPNFTFD